LGRPGEPERTTEKRKKDEDFPETEKSFDGMNRMNRMNGIRNGEETEGKREEDE